MCRRLSELREAMGAYAADFDADLVSVPDCERVVEEATALEHMAATVKAPAAAGRASPSARQPRGARPTHGGGRAHQRPLAREAAAQGRVEPLEAHAADALAE